MCLPNNASMEEVYKAQVECLQKELAKRDEEIEHLKDLLNIYDKERANYVYNLRKLPKEMHQQITTQVFGSPKVQLFEENVEMENEK